MMTKSSARPKIEYRVLKDQKALNLGSERIIIPSKISFLD